MALTKTARNKLLKLVQQSKRLLYLEIIDQLQHHYGIFPESGKVLLVEELTTSDADVLYKGRLLRDRLVYLSSNLADKKNEAIESIEQLIREQAFTILNRIAALRMAEERGIVKETIKNAYTSEGFQVYDSTTGQGATASIFVRYKWYLNAVFDELAIDLPSIFDRFSPYAIIFPDEKSLLEIIELINSEDLAIHREDRFAPINLWQQDETIGWIYQYYNGREEISVMREASPSPRNSNELAVRNQFFTPRYVVQFLTDNSLGSLWFEMTKGDTRLNTVCGYLIKRQNLLFLNKGETRPKNTDSNRHYIEHREIKDPRTIYMLDPACGSMHFGLYSFDLFEVIYLEAWDNFPELLSDLRNTMTRSEFIAHIPELIIRHNIHGVDIDPRALQIAALSLWLRAQKSFDMHGIDASKRPKITKSNLVLAEAMPINAELLSEIVKHLDLPIRQLVLDIWDKMKLSSETGLLLRIENEIDRKIQDIVKMLATENVNSQIEIGSTIDDVKSARQSAQYATKKYRAEFLDNAERKVLQILKELAENTDGGNAYQKLLFADDSARGFAFIELCRKRYDVILMNPPFGVGIKKHFEWQKNEYPDSYIDLLTCFVERMLELSCGFVGAISSRNLLVIPKLDRFRKRFLIPHLDILLDLGWPVMDDAMVQSAAYILNCNATNNNLISINRKGTDEKEKGLDEIVKLENEKQFYVNQKANFLDLPENRILYNLPKEMFSIFGQKVQMRDKYLVAKQGLKPMDDFRFVRTWVEVSSNKIGSASKWRKFAKGGGFSVFLMNLSNVINYSKDGLEMQELNRAKHGQIAQAKQGEEHYYKIGATYSIRTKKDFGISLLSAGHVIGGKGVIVLPKVANQVWFIIGLVNSSFINFLMKLQANDNQYDTGILESIPTKLFKDVQIANISNRVKDTILKIANYYSFFETSIYFDGIDLNKLPTELYNEFQFVSHDTQKAIVSAIDYIDSLIDSEFNVNSNEMLSQLNEFHEGSDDVHRDLEIINEINIKEFAHYIMSYLFGRMFQRFDTSKFNTKLEELSILRELDYSFVNPTSNIEYLVMNKWDHNGSNDLFKNLNETIISEINYADKFTTDLIEILGHRTIEDYVDSSKGFFDDHLNNYSLQRRTTPIYLPLSSINSNITVWIYYPALKSDTLFKLINYFNPYIDNYKEDLIRLANNNEKGSNYAVIKEIESRLTEIVEFQNELLEISKLPYSPNQDDGVLISSAPFHKLFHHPKWKKTTEECWKALEKGEYDWSHLAFTIWPDRVTQKCKKDLSMAIAHGLESICEVQPKEKKEKKAKQPKEIVKDLNLDF